MDLTAAEMFPIDHRRSLSTKYHMYSATTSVIVTRSMELFIHLWSTNRECTANTAARRADAHARVMYTNDGGMEHEQSIDAGFRIHWTKLNFLSACVMENKIYSQP